MKIGHVIFVAVLATTASAVPLPEAWHPCGEWGQPCAKRDAAPLPAPVAEPEPEAWHPCGEYGQPCAKRDASLENEESWFQCPSPNLLRANAASRSELVAHNAEATLSEIGKALWTDQALNRSRSRSV
jgi:hypothetical protein